MSYGLASQTYISRERPQRPQRHPDHPWCLDTIFIKVPAKRTDRNLPHTLSSHEDEDGDSEYEYLSSQPTHASFHERVDDGAILPHAENPGTNVDTAMKCNEI